jgi:hypothetical protein
MASMAGVQKKYRNIMENAKRPVWRVVVEAALKELGGTGSLKQIFDVVETRFPVSTRTWRDTIRRTAGEFFPRVTDGVFTLASAA